MADSCNYDNIQAKVFFFFLIFPNSNKDETWTTHLKQRFTKAKS